LTYLWVQVVEHLYRRLDAAGVDRVLDLLTTPDGVIGRMRLQVCLLLELGGSVGVSLHHQVVQDESVDVAEETESVQVSIAFANLRE
jgi:hypothetical protein